MKPRVLFLSNVPWDFVWQRHQTLASLWARQAAVDYVELPGVRRPGFRDLGRIARRAVALLFGAKKTGVAGAPPVRLLRPWVLPAVHPVLCAINARLIDRFLARHPGLRGPYLHTVIYTPARTGLQWLDRVEAGRILYDCTDDLTEVRGVPRFFADDEETLLRRAELTLVPSRVLYERKRSRARRIHPLPHGAHVERFVLPAKARGGDGAVTVLYYGHLHRQHLDFEALAALARARPSWRLILIGPVRSPHPWPPNVELPGQIEHAGLRAWIARADVVLLPYVLNNYTRAVMPAKTYECLASGRPVVATPLPELVATFPQEMSFVSPGGDWASAVEAALRADSAEARDRRVKRALANTWELRFGQIMELVGAPAEASS
jgi:glycosyltransferase involved in cell wall biosynthesis